MNLSSLQTMNPSFFVKAPVKILTRNNTPVLPVSAATLVMVKAAIAFDTWTSFGEIVDCTGLTLATVSRAAKSLARDGVAITKIDPTGQHRKRWLKLV